MEALLVSTGIVALAEIGDKTQLLALLLAARFRRPWPIVWGILAATIANHALAAAVGQWLSNLVPPAGLHLVLALCFIAVAIWTLVPDKLDTEDAPPISRYGAFMATLVAFFLAEMGDKTQVATVVLAAQFDAFVMVLIGTTIGMLLANVPVVFMGNAAAGRLPLGLIRAVAASAFLLMGLYAGWLAFSS
ncbi:TMEM165/GDT1 family protein [Halopseudomonas salegens]|uniref:GDT1 family protein n=1 Tax=Halopseudomonas salegens TaxID=1434072 RepID=A0A1H2EL97_9GAMM|nr:TMEM165/GDT1 family protein [Halopseudomonas salegens]SDT95538.1 Putative Ca2+/H+ antiporter, TMEM165/GDT1 family [Halopseudomonas salegens]